MENATYEVGSGVSFDIGAWARKFPESFLNAAKRGLAAKFTNEPSSAALRKFNVKSIDEVDSDELELFFEDHRQKMVDALMSGKVSVTAPGAPRGSGLESIMFELATAQAIKTLKTDRLAKGKPSLWPEANRKEGIKAEDATVVLAGEVVNRDDIVQAVLAKYGDELRVKAQAVAAERKAAQAAKPAKNVADKADEDLDDLI